MSPPARRAAEKFDPFVALCREHGLPAPRTEYRFHLVRKWRFDYAWPELPSGECPLWEGPVAVEVEGGAFTRGRHTRGAGFVADLQKYNAGVLLGWRILRYTPQQLTSGSALAEIHRALGSTT